MPNRVPLIKPKSPLHLSVFGLIALVAVLAALSVGLENVHAQTPPTAPTVSSIAITSSPGSDNTYATGDIITVSLTFSEAVTVNTTGGTPDVQLNIGGSRAFANYSGDGSSAVVQPFSYTVEPFDRDSNGVSLLANSLRLDGGTIQATDDSANATLTHSAMSFPSHKAAAAGDLLVGLAQVGIPVVAVLNNGGVSTSNEALQWQRSATEAGVYSDIPAAEGGTSTPYTPSAGDLGRWLKATVTYDDTDGTGWTAEWDPAGAVATHAVQRGPHSRRITGLHSRSTRDAEVRAAVHDRIAHARLPADGSTSRAFPEPGPRRRDVGGACQRRRQAGGRATCGCSPNPGRGRR